MHSTTIDPTTGQDNPPAIQGPRTQFSCNFIRFYRLRILRLFHRQSVSDPIQRLLLLQQHQWRNIMAIHVQADCYASFIRRTPSQHLVLLVSYTTLCAAEEEQQDWVGRETRPPCQLRP